MTKTLKIYSILLVVVIALLTVFQFTKKEVINWTKNYKIDNKHPFGLYVFNKEVNALFHNKLKKPQESPYNYYKGNPKKGPHNILIIQEYIDQESMEKVLDQVEKGSDLMLISNKSNFSIKNKFKVSPYTYDLSEQNALKLTDIKLKTDSIYLNRFPNCTSFELIQKDQMILGTTVGDKTAIANFLKIKHGKGNIYYHAEPLFLTNYYMLKYKKNNYLTDVFSYLPNRETLWFTKQAIEESDDKIISDLSFIFQNKPLRNGWYLLLLGVILFIIFNSKRVQRPIAIVKPKENKSLEFIQSIGNLYLQEGDFHDMMNKKANYFLANVRQRYLIDTRKLDDDFAHKLSLKSGVPMDKVNEAIVLIKKGQDPYADVRKEDLLHMNTLLDEILPPQ